MFPNCTRNDTGQDGWGRGWDSETCKEESSSFCSSSSSSCSSSSLASSSKTSPLPRCFSFSPSFWFRPLPSLQCLVFPICFAWPWSPCSVFPTCFVWFPTCFASSCWPQRAEGTKWATPGVWWCATFGMLHPSFGIRWTKVCPQTLAGPKMRRQRLPQGSLWPASLSDVAVFPLDLTSVGSDRWGASERGPGRASFKYEREVEADTLGAVPWTWGQSSLQNPVFFGEAGSQST